MDLLQGGEECPVPPRTLGVRLCTPVGKLLLRLSPLHNHPPCFKGMGHNAQFLLLPPRRALTCSILKAPNLESQCRNECLSAPSTCHRHLHSDSPTHSRSRNITIKNHNNNSSSSSIHNHHHHNSSSSTLNSSSTRSSSRDSTLLRSCRLPVVQVVLGITVAPLWGPHLLKCTVALLLGVDLIHRHSLGTSVLVRTQVLVAPVVGVGMVPRDTQRLWRGTILVHHQLEACDTRPLPLLMGAQEQECPPLPACITEWDHQPGVLGLVPAEVFRHRQHHDCRERAPHPAAQCTSRLECLDPRTWDPRVTLAVPPLHLLRRTGHPCKTQEGPVLLYPQIPRLTGVRGVVAPPHRRVNFPSLQCPRHLVLVLRGAPVVRQPSLVQRGWSPCPVGVQAASVDLVVRRQCLYPMSSVSSSISSQQVLAS